MIRSACEQKSNDERVEGADGCSAYGGDDEDCSRRRMRNEDECGLVDEKKDEGASIESLL
jgi:hypothetical protein